MFSSFGATLELWTRGRESALRGGIGQLGGAPRACRRASGESGPYSGNSISASSRNMGWANGQQLLVREEWRWSDCFGRGFVMRLLVWSFVPQVSGLLDRRGHGLEESGEERDGSRTRGRDRWGVVETKKKNG